MRYVLLVSALVLAVSATSTAQQESPSATMLQGWLRTARDLQPPVLGASLAPVDAVLRSHLGIAEETGRVVTEVAAGSPASGAGLEVHDVITHVDGARVGRHRDRDRRRSG